MPVSALTKMSMFNTTSDFLLQEGSKEETKNTKENLSGKKTLDNVSKWQVNTVKWQSKGNY